MATVYGGECRVCHHRFYGPPSPGTYTPHSAIAPNFRCDLCDSEIAAFMEGR